MQENSSPPQPDPNQISVAGSLRLLHLLETTQNRGAGRPWEFNGSDLRSFQSISQLRPYLGLAVRVKVTGVEDGPVWGSNAYTDDSSLNAAALHARLVKAGETGEVVVIIRPGMSSYGASESGGVTSLDYGVFPGSFQLAPVSQYPDAPYFCDRHVLRNTSEKFLSLNKLAGQASLKPGTSLIVPLRGQAGAPTVGTDRYASDCNLDAAVVHAGVLNDGESGYVKIILEEGLESYSGSVRNGVESYPFGKTTMSLRFEKLHAQPRNPNAATSLNESLRNIEDGLDGNTSNSFDGFYRAMGATETSSGR